MRRCTQPAEDGAFENLRGINTLGMSGCDRITDKAVDSWEAVGRQSRAGRH